MAGGDTKLDLAEQLRRARAEAEKNVSEAAGLNVSEAAALESEPRTQQDEGAGCSGEVRAADCDRRASVSCGSNWCELTGSIRLGYYPHLGIGRVAGQIQLNAAQAATNLTHRMVQLGSIQHDSVVLELGCGRGQTCHQIAQCSGDDAQPHMRDNTVCTHITLSITRVAY